MWGATVTERRFRPGFFVYRSARGSGMVVDPVKHCEKGANDMADKQPMIRPHIWLIALGLVIVFVLFYLFG